MCDCHFPWYSLSFGDTQFIWQIFMFGVTFYVVQGIFGKEKGRVTELLGTKVT